MVLGAPSDENSSYMKGPPLVREALHSGSANLCVEGGLDLGAETRWTDVGDLEFPDPGEAFQRIEETVAGLLARDARVLTLVGVDIVESNPKRDPAGVTAMVAAKLLKEIVSKTLEQETGNQQIPGGRG